LSQGDFAGVIGAEILPRFKLIFDYPRGRMIIEPNGTFRAPYEFDMSGLFITSEGGSSKAFKVYSIIKGSPATEAGIRGDVIDAIDERPASKFTLDQVRQLFKEAEGKEHSLSIRGDGKLHTAKLRLRRLI
jgi:C-terminal processing protease CtpA/Prc